MWNPTPGWQAAPSFVEAVTPPDTEPGASPLVCVQFNRTWLPYIIGCLQQLIQPPTWDTTDPTALQTALDRATALMDMFGTSGECSNVQFRFTDACLLQYSIDGGATWLDTPGWDTFAHTCFVGPTGPTGPTGGDGPPGPASQWRLESCELQYSNDGGVTWTDATGWSTDAIGQCLSGTPGNPTGVSTAQQACNIANWLAVEVLQASLTSAAASIAAVDSTYTAVTGLLGLAIGFTGIVGLAADVLGIFFAAATAIGSTALSAAGGDATLRSDIVCAIYDAIRTDGHLTAANFATAAGNINAISYGTPGIVGLIYNYFNGLGYTGVAAIQGEGALYLGDCTGCTASPLNSFSFNSSGINNIQLASKLVPGDAFTWAAWVDVGSVDGSFVSDIDTVATNPRWSFGMGGGIIGAGFVSAGGTVYSCVAAMTTGVHLVAVVLDTGTLRIYVDGAQVASTAIPTGTSWVSAGAVTQFGHEAYVPLPQQYTGLMWSVGVWATALSAGSLAAWYAAGTSAPLPGAPYGQWLLNEGVGGSAADTRGGNTGTVAGAQTWAAHP